MNRAKVQLTTIQTLTSQTVARSSATVLCAAYARGRALLVEVEVEAAVGGQWRSQLPVPEHRRQGEQDWAFAPRWTPSGKIQKGFTPTVSTALVLSS